MFAPRERRTEMKGVNSNSAGASWPPREQRGLHRSRPFVGITFLVAMLALGGGCVSTVGDNINEQELESAVLGDVVSSWNQAAQAAIITVAGAPPAQDSYWSAIMHVAMYDAVNAVGGRGGRYLPLVASPTPRNPASREAAAVAAAHHVLSTLMPSQKATFDAKLANDLAQISDGKKKDNGVAMGVEAAQQVLAAHDGVIPAVTYTPPSGPGNWQPVPPAFATVLPGFGLVTPFTMSSQSQFRPGPPPALTSDVWAADYNETKNYGGGGDSPNLATDDQKNIGRLYGIEHPGAQYHRVVRRIAQENELTLTEAARFFAMVYVQFTDASIACWDAKFHYHFWRPYTAIRNGDTDGNDATAPDPSWTPLVPTPGHPEYPAAHGCFTGGFVGVLRAYFGTDQVHVIIDSAPTGLSHEFFDLDDLNAEIVLARIYGGMHYRNSVEVGIGMGAGIAAQLSTNFFQRLPE